MIYNSHSIPINIMSLLPFHPTMPFSYDPTIKKKLWVKKAGPLEIGWIMEEIKIVIRTSKILKISLVDLVNSHLNMSTGWLNEVLHPDLFFISSDNLLIVWPTKKTVLDQTALHSV